MCGAVSGPTKGAIESKSGTSGSWAASPWMARGVRAAIFVTPLLIAWVFIRLTGFILYRPPGWFGVVVWSLQALVVGTAVARQADRLMHRFLPLATLLGLSLTFPDQAPSRFSVALRTGTVNKMQARMEQLTEDGLDADAAVAAHQAVELVGALGHHERLTRGHTERVRAYADLIAKEMDLPEEDRQKLTWAVLLHDIGKLKVPAHILNKDGRPTNEEWDILKTHPAEGEAFLEPLAEWLGEWRLATSQHHERWDGEGYPRGLAGDEISLAGRITAVADAYDVITSKRSYKSAMSGEAGRQELVRCSGKQFDPAVVRAFLRVSVGERNRKSGAFAWLLELPGMTSVANGLAAAPAASVASVAAATALVAGVPIAPEPPAEQLALIELIEMASPTIPWWETNPTIVIRPTSTTSSTIETDESAPSTTGSPSTAPPLPVSSSAPSTTKAPSTTALATTAPSTTTPSTTATPPSAPTTVPSTTTTITAPDGAPTANDDSANVDEGDDKRIRVLDNDDSGGSNFDNKTLSIVSVPANGKVRVHKNHIHYESSDEFIGTESFTYRICNTDGLCDSATVTVTILD